MPSTMTSLQRQLASIAATSTNELNLKAQRTAHAKSLLFEPSEAAAQSFDSLYQICVEGFDELCALDARFDRFAKSIFSPHSKSENRAQMTRAEDDKLSSVLKGFLELVGPRLMLKPALKAVEWLVRRFRIHEYDTEWTILTFLPYHSTHLFPALLAILPKQLSSSFKFLHPYMSTLKNPPQSAITYTAAHNPAFFDALNQYVITVSKTTPHNKALLSFWAGVAAQTVEAKLRSSQSGRINIQAQREEDFLMQILPVIHEGLMLRKATELVLGCYMLIVVLVSKVDLDNATLDAFLQAVANSWTNDTIDSGLSCAAVIAESKDNEYIPTSVCQKLFKIDSIGRKLAQLSSAQYAQNLIVGVGEEALQTIISGDASLLRVIRDLLEDRSLDVACEKKITGLIAETLQGVGDPSSLAIPSMKELQQLAVSQHAQSEEAKNGHHSGENSESDLDMQESDPRSNAVLVDTISLPDEIAENNFLARSASPAYSQLASVFGQLILSGKSTLSFFDLPAWKSEGEFDRFRVLSFLIRTWITNQSSTVRSKAILVAVERLTREATNAEVDAMLLYNIVGLMDKSRKTRKQAALAIQYLARLDLLARRPTAYSLLTDLYGRIKAQEDNVVFATLNDFVLKFVLSSLDECVADRAHLLSVFRVALKSSSEPQSREGTKLKHLKSEQRDDLLKWISQHVHHTSVMTAKYRLLSIATALDKINKEPRSIFFLPSLKQWADSSDSEALSCRSENFLSADLDAVFFETIHPSDDEAINFALNVAQGRYGTVRRALQDAAFTRLHSLWPNLKEGRRIKVAQTLLDSVDSNLPDSLSSNAMAESTRLLRNVKSSPPVLLALLAKVNDGLVSVSETPSSSPAKKRRTDRGSVISSEGNEADIKRTLLRSSLVLEIVDDSKHEYDITMFHEVFKTLRILQGFQIHALSDVGYLQALGFSKLAKIAQQFMSQASAPKLDLAVIRVDLVIDCVRNTTNTQARNSALLLLAALTRYLPQLVLQNLIPIFTLMSASTMRQSDEFSIYVVRQTIEGVIPLLANSLRCRNQDLIVATAEVLLSFAGAFDHISHAQRIPLFKLLATSLGQDESLYAIITTLVDRHPHNGEVTRFSAGLLRQFETPEALNTVVQYLRLASNAKESVDSTSAALLKSHQDSRDADSIFVNLLSTVPRLLREGIPKAQLQDDLLQDDEASQITSCFRDLFRTAIQLSKLLKKEKRGHPIALEILEEVLALMPFNEFIKSVEPILDKDDDQVSQSILKSVEQQIRTSKQFDFESKNAAINFLPRLNRLLRGSTSESLKLGAVACVDRICEQFGKLNTDATMEAAKTVVSSCFGQEDVLLRVVALHTMASCVEVLQNEFIPLLQQSVTLVSDALVDAASPKSQNLRLHNASLALATALVDRFPYLLSPTAFDSLVHALSKAASSQLGSGAASTRAQFLSVVSARVPIKPLFETAERNWLDALRNGPSALNQLLQVIFHCLEHTGKSAVIKDHRSILETFFTFLDLRKMIPAAQVTSKYETEESINNLENTILEILLALVFKINDTIFRPFFIRVVDWSVGSANKTVSAFQTPRIITVFNFLTVLSQRLKSLVTSYFDYVIDPAASILNSKTASKEDKSTTALKLAILRAFSLSFQQDDSSFYHSPSRFQRLLPAVVAPLSQGALSSTLTEHAITAVVSLAVAIAAVPDHLDKLTDSLVALCKSESSKIRVITVRTMRRLTDTEGLGADWLGQCLPRMKQVVAELQEDDVEAVERETTGWIKAMEACSGERIEDTLA
ncbi:MAG: snoRNA-binding rRNA-processing protein utp10 [Alyxoria varia]|nr:MAG: snoRNA-binding rRNA-processing protein utp10 [Alyxoria varia]